MRTKVGLGAWVVGGGLVASGCLTPMEEGPAADVLASEEDGELAPGFTESAVYTEDQWRTATGAALPESGHPYRNNLSEAAVVDAPGCAQATRLRFERIELRSGDSLSLYGADGRRAQRITGTRSNFVTNAVTGTQVRLVLRTNGSGTAYGYKVSAVQVVEGAIPCPMIAWRMCGEDQVTMARDPTPVCACPRPPRCEALTDFTATFGAGGGFSGGWSGQLLDGRGQLWRVRRQTAGSQEERTLVGFASLARTKQLAEALQGMDFFRRQNPHDAANMTVTFAAVQGALQGDASWPSGGQPPEMEPAVSAFTKAATCGTDADAAHCASGFACQNNECVEAPSCICPMLYAPVCSEFHTTYGNACGASCAGEPVAHTGACGIDGEPCGGTAQLSCADGFACFYGPEGQPSREPSYPLQPGTCRPADGTGCACPEIYAPVCGSDGRTYASSCQAGCQGVAVARTGPCGAAGDPCAPDNGWTCAVGLTCQENVCQDQPACVCRMMYSPVCAVNGTTYNSPCDAACDNAPVLHDGPCGTEGDTCGTIRGLVCQDAFKCRYAESTYVAPYPDAGGTCVPSAYCDAPIECGTNVRLSCPATWFCESHACRYECNAPVERWVPEEVTFQTAHPYANDARKGWTATGDADTRAIRFVFDRFETETDYDFVTLYDEGWNEVIRYSGTLAAFTTVEVPGRVAHVVFTSDTSVTRWGVRGVRVEYRKP
ncbi:MAG: hypothetical protein HY904_23505 [Deltaproteobacteria bacterium]|nr:hypothetical protein [Deltaproteobacteria bacterium]